MDPTVFLRALAYWLRSDDGKLGTVHAEDKVREADYAALVGSLN
jgi:hypothetical protein